MHSDVEVLADPPAVARAAAAYVAERARVAVADHGSFHFAVSGGHTPWAMFAELPATLAWDRVTIFQVDERVAPDGDPDRNLTHLLESLQPDPSPYVRSLSPARFLDRPWDPDGARSAAERVYQEYYALA